MKQTLALCVLAVSAAAHAAPTPPNLALEHVDVAFNYDGQWHIGPFDKDNFVQYAAGDVWLFAADIAGVSRLNRPANAAYNFIGTAAGQPFWNLPLNPSPQLLYLGAGTEDTTPSLLDSYIETDPRLPANTNAKWMTLSLTSVQNTDIKGRNIAGHFSAFQTDTFGTPIVWMASSDGITSADKLVIPAGAHVHYNWAFSARGLYKVAVRASARSGGSTISSDTQTFTFAIGVNQWSADGGGSYSASGNWVGNVPAPNGAGQWANFLSAIAADSSVAVASPVTLGQLNFGSGFAYTLTGTAAITLSDSAGAQLNVIQGSHTVQNPIVLASPTLIEIVPADAVLTLGLVSGNTALTKAGPGTVALARLSGPALAITAGIVRLRDSVPGIEGDVAGQGFNGGTGGTIGVGSTSVLASLTIAPDATLDLRNNDAVIRTGASVDSLRAAVALAYNGGLWNTPGITSSRAAADGLAVGFGANADLGYATFSGVATTPADHYLKYTWFGDANLDGQVDGDDYLLWLAVFGSSGAGIGWGQGDFDYDADTDGDDYLLWLQNFGNGLGSPLVAVPEPGVVGLASVAAAGLLARRRRAVR